MLKPKTLLLSVISGLMTLFGYGQSKTNQPPLRIGVAGLTHTHVHWILGREDRGDIEIVGIAEPNRDLAERFAKQHGFSMDIVFPSMEEMLDKTKPEAVTAFNSTFEHLETVEICAPRGIHIMVEKPLAVNSKHAKKMAALARQHQVQLLTNYETTWYATNHKAYELVHEKQHIGPIRKMVIHDGHQGPKEIGVNQEFLDWLTDPVLNGGGAVTDFGCYGANLMAWLMKGQRPSSVSATLQTIKPNVYPKVDDEATIVLTYPEAQGIIQASWNWPYSRKDTEIYGKEGYIIAENRSQMRSRPTEKAKETRESLEERKDPVNDPFAYLAAVIQGRIQPPPFALSSLENNLIVVEILDAAKKSAKKGKVIKMK